MPYLKFLNIFIACPKDFKNINEVLNLLKMIKSKTNLKLPEMIIFKTSMKSSSIFTENKISIDKSIKWPNMAFILLHEIIHNNGYKIHNKKFWRKFFKICQKFNIPNIENYINKLTYKNAKKYFKKYYNA